MIVENLCTKEMIYCTKIQSLKDIIPDEFIFKRIWRLVLHNESFSFNVPYFRDTLWNGSKMKGKDIFPK